MKQIEQLIYMQPPFSQLQNLARLEEEYARYKACQNKYGERFIEVRGQQPVIWADSRIPKVKKSTAF